MRIWRTIKATCIAMFIGAMPWTAASALGAEYEVDKQHSTVFFRVKHLNVSYFQGRFNDVKGSFTFDKDNPTDLAIKVEIAVRSIDTHDKKRDLHLKGPDFFNVKQYKTITFESTRAKAGKDNTYEVSGNLTLHGVTKEITVDLTFVGEGKDPWGGYRAGFDTSFTIKRTDFGMNYLLGGLGDEIRINVGLEGIRR